MLTNSTGVTQSVPTGTYAVEVRYPHWQKNYSVIVAPNQTASCPIAPHFGGLQLGCNQTDATFQMQDADGQWVANGNLLAKVDGLPAGVYQLTASHHGHQRTDALTVRPDTNISAQLDFRFGKAVFTTTPSGASVTTTDDGRSWGETPLTLPELLPGNWNFTLQRSGYQSVQLSVKVEADQDCLVTTNLVSENYLHAMTTARQFMAAADYNRALQSANEALDARPGDADALALQHEATGLGLIQHAKMLGQQGDYIGGGKELKQALQSLPDNEAAKELLAEFQKKIPGQLAQEKAERLLRPRLVFDQELKLYSDSDLFESHELKSSKPWNEVEKSIATAFQDGQPAFQITRRNSGQPEVFVVEARQQFMTYLKTSAGFRRVVIVGGQKTDDETQIFFIVYEYKAEAAVKFSIGNLIGTPDAVNYVPIHSSRMAMTDALNARIADGVAMVTGKIQMALGETPPATVPPPVPQ